MAAVPQSSQPGPPPKTRGLGRILRRTRRLALAALVLAAVILLYLHHVGLPRFARNTLVAQLQARGIDLDYGRIGLRWYRGILAEDVTLRRSGSPESGELHLSQLALRLNPAALLRFRLELRSLEIEGGRLALPLAGAADQPQTLSLDNVDAQLEFPPRDCWQLRQFSADCLGVRLALHGTLTNASSLRNWAKPRPGAPPTPAWESSVRRFIQLMKRLKFDRTPWLSAEFVADAARLEAAQVVLRFGVNQSQSPWGSLQNLTAALHLNEEIPIPGRGTFSFLLEIRGLHSSPLNLGRLQLAAHWLQPFTNTVPESLDATLRLDQLQSPWFDTTSLELAGQGRQAPGPVPAVVVDFQLAGGGVSGGRGQSDTNALNLQLAWNLDDLLPQHGRWDLTINAPRFDWGSADTLQLQGNFARRAADPAADVRKPRTSRPPGLTLLEPFIVETQGHLSGVTRSNIVVDRVAFTARWEAPHLSVRPLQVDLFDRRLLAETTLNVDDRSLASELAFDFNVRRLGPLLPAGVQRWLGPYGWEPEGPPLVHARTWMQLPPWDPLDPRRADYALGDTLGVLGTLTATNASFRGVPMETVGFDFHYTNQIWRLTNFVATAPEGRVGMTYTEDQRSSDYRFDLDAQLDPKALKPLVPPGQQPAFDLFAFPHPPSVQGYVAGRWRTPGSTTFGGQIRSPQFAFRGEPIEGFSAQLGFTNARVSATRVQFRSDGDLNAEGVGFDTARQLLFLTNAHTTIAPDRVARAIGPAVVRALAPYQFTRPPHATANGWLDVRQTRNVDLTFEIQGGPFHYWRFRVPEIGASVAWSNQTVRVENLKAAFYDGRLTGRIDVNLDVPQGADLNFESRFQDVDFAPLAVDVLQYTNRTEGRIFGNWILTHANSDDWNSWQGFGQGELRDGYLWDLPVFGALSTVMAGMGVQAARNPVTGVTTDFTLTNSIIHTRNLELRSAAMRIGYRGTFDFAGGMNGRAEAQILRDSVFFGPIVSLVLSPLTKLFEFRVTGTIGDPVLEPLYIPKPLLFPLNPIGTIRELLKNPETKAPQKE